MARILMVLILAAGLIACESRPPVDVYGHKDSLYHRLIIGVPF